MKIGSIDLGERPILLAPMEDITDVPFRLLCREQGADMVYTEFIPSDGYRRCGKLLVKETFAGEESLTDLLTEYIERTASLRY